MNGETMLMKELTLGFYREHFQQPETMYLNDLRQIRTAQGVTLEEAIDLLFQRVTGSLMNEILEGRDKAHVPTTRSRAHMTLHHNGDKPEPVRRELVKSMEGFGYTPPPPDGL